MARTDDVRHGGYGSAIQSSVRATRSRLLFSGAWDRSRWNLAAHHHRSGKAVNRSLVGALLIGAIVYFNATLVQHLFYTADVPKKNAYRRDNVIMNNQESFIQAMETGCSFTTYWQNCSREDFNNSIILGNSASVSGFVTIATEVDEQTVHALETTLSSILSSSTPEERRDVIIVIYLRERIADWAVDAISQRLRELFSEHLDSGFFQVVQSPLTTVYELLESRGLLDSREEHPRSETTHGTNPQTRLQTTSAKPVEAVEREAFSLRLLDLAYLFKFYQHVHQTEHFVHFSHDVAVEKGFITAIVHYVRHHRSKFWVTLDFATLGFVGKLYRRESLQSFADFCLFFSREQQPIELLYQYYNDLRMQRHNFLREPSIFRRVSNRSLILQRFGLEQRPPDNPPGKVYSTMQPFSKGHLPQLAYQKGDRTYFYGKFPRRGDEVVLVFDKPAPVRGVVVKTGLQNFPKRAEGSTRDILLDGKLEVSQKIVNRDAHVPECEDYRTIGYSILGSFSVSNIDETYRESIACLRISVSQTQVQWIALREISVWLK